MTTFYRGPCVRITHKVFETRYPNPRSFLLADLHFVHVVERAASPPAALSSARVGSTGVAGAAAVAIALSRAEQWQPLESPTLTLGLIVLLLVSIAVSGGCWSVRPMELELAALYHGEPVTLYCSTDLEDFGQIKRALIRALELRDDT